MKEELYQPSSVFSKTEGKEEREKVYHISKAKPKSQDEQYEETLFKQQTRQTLDDIGVGMEKLLEGYDIDTVRSAFRRDWRGEEIFRMLNGRENPYVGILKK